MVLKRFQFVILCSLLASNFVYAGEEAERDVDLGHQRESLRQVGEGETFRTMKDEANEQADALSSVGRNSSAALAARRLRSSQSPIAEDFTAFDPSLKKADYRELYLRLLRMPGLSPEILEQKPEILKFLGWGMSNQSPQKAVEERIVPLFHLFLERRFVKTPDDFVKFANLLKPLSDAKVSVPELFLSSQKNEINALVAKKDYANSPLLNEEKALIDLSDKMRAFIKKAKSNSAADLETLRQSFLKEQVQLGLRASEIEDVFFLTLEDLHATEGFGDERTLQHFKTRLSFLEPVTLLNIDQALEWSVVPYDKIMNFASLHKVTEASLKQLITRAADDKNGKVLFDLIHLMNQHNAYMKYSVAAETLLRRFLESPDLIRKFTGATDFEELARLASVSKTTHFLAINRVLDLAQSVAVQMPGASAPEAQTLGALKYQMQALIASLSRGKGPEHIHAVQFVYSKIFKPKNKFFFESRVTLQRLVKLKPSLKLGLTAVQISTLRVATSNAKEEIAPENFLFSMTGENEISPAFYDW